MNDRRPFSSVVEVSVRDGHTGEVNPCVCAAIRKKTVADFMVQKIFWFGREVYPSENLIVPITRKNNSRDN